MRRQKKRLKDDILEYVKGRGCVTPEEVGVALEIDKQVAQSMLRHLVRRGVLTSAKNGVGHIIYCTNDVARDFPVADIHAPVTLSLPVSLVDQMRRVARGMPLSRFVEHVIREYLAKMNENDEFDKLLLPGR